MKKFKKAGWILLILFIFMNLMAICHAWNFTHFSESGGRSKSPENLSLGEKLTLIFTGTKHQKSSNVQKPDRPYETFELNDDYNTSCWLIKVPDAKGTFILCHGFASSKSGMLRKAYVLMGLGYNVMLIDFMACGDTKGETTTIGYNESVQVKSSIDEMKRRGEKNIHLLGTSMGAAAIMKCMQDFRPEVGSIVLECPFSTLYCTVKARFRIMGVPSFPMASLLTFWGGTLNGFNAFEHAPTEYAKSIECPVLLMSGALDPKVSLEETEEINSHFKGKHRKLILPNSGHEEYLNKDADLWTNEVRSFLFVNTEAPH